MSFTGMLGRFPVPEGHTGDVLRSCQTTETLEPATVNVPKKTWPAVSPLKPEKPENVTYRRLLFVGSNATCVIERLGRGDWAVRSVQLWPPLTVIATCPMLLPVAMRLESVGATASAVNTQPTWEPQDGLVAAPVTSGEIAAQLAPSFTDCQTRTVPKYNRCGFWGSSVRGGMKLPSSEPTIPASAGKKVVVPCALSLSPLNSDRKMPSSEPGT